MIRVGRYFILLGAVILLLSAGSCGTAAKVKRERMGEAHFKLGMALLNNNQLQKAFVEFQKSVESDPKNRDAHYALGHVYFVRGQFIKAEKEFLATQKIDPEYPESHNYLGKVYEGMQKWELAISEYQKALASLKYETPEKAHYNLGIALLNTDDHEGALEEFDKAIRFNSSFAVAYLGKGQVYSRMNRNSKAIEAFQLALNLFPTNPRINFELGVVYFKAQSPVEAKMAFEKVIEFAPEGKLAEDSKQYLERLQ